MQCACIHQSMHFHLSIGVTVWPPCAPREHFFSNIKVSIGMGNQHAFVHVSLHVRWEMISSMRKILPIFFWWLQHKGLFTWAVILVNKARSVCGCETLFEVWHKLPLIPAIMPPSCRFVLVAMSFLRSPVFSLLSLQMALTKCLQKTVEQIVLSKASTSLKVWWRIQVFKGRFHFCCSSTKWTYWRRR